jgi:cyclopropane fatty-acyl-phospholipid synthase-like methyltransferase
LSCVCAEFYKLARVTGIDTFKHASLKGSSIDRARENARTLGFSKRIDFEASDVFAFKPAERFDVVVSNLVYHNLGKKRFEAYSRISSWVRKGGFVVIGDLFFSPKADLDRLSKEFRILREARPKKGLTDNVLLVMQWG